MKENFTSINVIIDQSGSMGNVTLDTIGGFNSFLGEQKLVPGEAVVTLCTFNSTAKTVHDFVKLASVPNLDSTTYVPGGNTALLDAIGKTINSVGEKLSAMPEEERPSKVIFLIITDGEENASREFSASQIKSMVEHQTNTYNWNFVFMGANIDAITAGASLGIAATNSLNYQSTSQGTHDLYKGVSRGLESYRIGSSNTTKDFFNRGSK